ncbi:MAG: NAD(P)H-binding protein [Pseudonocardiaceae bacterium]
MRILVAGASGFVGARLCPALVADGHQVVAMTRYPENYRGAGTAVGADVADEDSLAAACAGCDAAYYLVHSLDVADFSEQDARAALSFAAAAGAAGLTRIVYLGGLGEDADDLSAHLRSRRAVEGLLGSTGVTVISLRAGIIVGHGGISWELTRQLVEHLPVMITPLWVRTRAQPIAIADVVRYLVGVLTLGGTDAVSRSFDIGGPEVLTYLEMMRRVAVIEGRRMVVVPVPLLSPRLSSRWLSLVTDVDVATGRSLIDSMSNEVIVREDSIRALVPFEPMGYDQAVLQALGERAAARRAPAGFPPAIVTPRTP